MYVHLEFMIVCVREREINVERERERDMLEEK